MEDVGLEVYLESWVGFSVTLKKQPNTSGNLEEENGNTGLEKNKTSGFVKG